MDLNIYNVKKSSFYIEEASIYDLLYSNIIDFFNSNGAELSKGIKRYSENNIITRQWLDDFYQKYNYGERLQIHIDLGGEGEIVTAVNDGQMESIFISGFKNAINLNGQIMSSQNRGGLSENIIPHLILLPNWNEKFPFADGTIDYLTMQSIPIVLPCPLDIEDMDIVVNKCEYENIVRCISDGGKISIWCQNFTDNNGMNAAEIAKEFIDEYKKLSKHSGFPDANAVENWKIKKKNRYACFYSYLPKDELEEVCTYDIVPVKIEYEEINFLGSGDSIRLDLLFYI